MPWGKKGATVVIQDPSCTTRNLEGQKDQLTPEGCQAPPLHHPSSQPQLGMGLGHGLGKIKHWPKELGHPGHRAQPGGGGGFPAALLELSLVSGLCDSGGCLGWGFSLGSTLCTGDGEPC